MENVFSQFFIYKSVMSSQEYHFYFKAVKHVIETCVIFFQSAYFSKMNFKHVNYLFPFLFRRIYTNFYFSFPRYAIESGTPKGYVCTEFCQQERKLFDIPLSSNS